MGACVQKEERVKNIGEMYITIPGIFFLFITFVQFGSICLNAYYIIRNQFEEEHQQPNVSILAIALFNQFDQLVVPTITTTTIATTTSIATRSTTRSSSTIATRLPLRPDIYYYKSSCLINFDNIDVRFCDWYTKLPIDRQQVGNSKTGDSIHYYHENDRHGCFKLPSTCFRNNNISSSSSRQHQYILFRDFGEQCNTRFRKIAENIYNCPRLGGIDVFSKRRFKLIIGATAITRQQKFWSGVVQQLRDTEHFIRGVRSEPFSFIYLNVSYHSNEKKWNTVGGGETWSTISKRPVTCVMRINLEHGELMWNSSASVAAHEFLHCLCMDSGGELWNSMHTKRFDADSNLTISEFWGKSTTNFLNGRRLVYMSKYVDHFQFNSQQSYLDGFPSVDPYQAWYQYRNKNKGRPFSPLVKHVLTDYGYEIDEFKFQVG